jgi:hypothetical protein
MAVDQALVGAEEVEAGECHQTRPRPVSGVGRADKGTRLAGPLTISQWRGLSATKQLDWLKANVQVKEDDGFRLLAQIEQASRPQRAKPKCGCPPGGWKKEKAS